MKSARHIDSKRPEIRRGLRIIGPLIAILGLAFATMGLMTFFGSFHYCGSVNASENPSVMGQVQCGEIDCPQIFPQMWRSPSESQGLPAIAPEALKEETPMAEKRLGELSVEELDSLIGRISKSKMSNAEKIVYYSGRFLGTPYELFCQGDGPYARYDTAPLMNFKQINCMTYCEQVLALALSSHYEEMFNVLQHIRYRNGIIGMATRNHYTMADWLQENSWCLEDITEKVGPEYYKRLTRIISHKKFFAQKGITDIKDVLPDRRVTISYIPLADLTKIIYRLHSGDIVALIQDKPGIFSDHMLLIYKDEKGRTFFRHATMATGTTLDVPYEEYVSGLKKSKKKYLGMSFMRVREDVQWVSERRLTHGKVIF